MSADMNQENANVIDDMKENRKAVRKKRSPVSIVMLISSLVSVPRPTKRCSKSVKDGGVTNNKRALIRTYACLLSDRYDT